MARIEPDELRNLDAVAQADLVRRGEVAPLELVEAAIERIERVNPKLNAVVTPMFDLARDAARRELPDGPLRGVPYLLKDLMGTFAGVRETSGSRLLLGNVPRHDSELVARLKRAGLVIVGKTNTPEFGIPPTTEPHLFGPARNPWNPEHSTGGSSGGSAAAVAAGLVPAAHANDGGGSIRIPASCCGLFGLKPTRGRNPLGPDFGDIASGLVAEHAVTRSVRDSAVLLDATSGPDVGDPYAAPPRARPFRDEVGADPGRLRIGYTTTSPMGEVHPDCIRAVEDAAALCRSLGHDVEQRTPDIDVAHIQESFFQVFSAGAAMHVEAALQALGREPREDELEPLTRAVTEIGRGISAPAYLIAMREVQSFSRRIAHALLDLDVWITPTLCEPPLRLGVLDAPPDNPFAALLRAAQYVPFTPLCNMTGQPAMSMPLHWNEAGLPIGTHFIARFGDEATLFRLAAQLEAARPWASRRPPICA